MHRHSTSLSSVNDNELLNKKVLQQWNSSPLEFQRSGKSCCSLISFKDDDLLGRDVLMQ